MGDSETTLKQQKLWDAFVQWRDKIGIYSAESCYQTDEVVLTAYELVETLCEIAGYTPPPEEEEL